MENCYSSDRFFFGRRANWLTLPNGNSVDLQTSRTKSHLNPREPMPECQIYTKFRLSSYIYAGIGWENQKWNWRKALKKLGCGLKLNLTMKMQIKWGEILYLVRLYSPSEMSMSHENNPFTLLTTFYTPHDDNFIKQPYWHFF